MVKNKYQKGMCILRLYGIVCLIKVALRIINITDHNLLYVIIKFVIIAAFLVFKVIKQSNNRVCYCSAH